MNGADDEADALGNAAVRLAVELVRTDSVNPGLVAGAEGEEAVVALLAERLGASGYAIEVVRPVGARDRPSLVATRRGTGGGRSLALYGHLDTVGVEGMSAPFTATIDGDERTGRLVGRGACDMKAAVAAMVVVAEAAAGTAGDVVLALVADEENASLGAEAVLAHLRAAGRLPDACVVGEPTWLDLAVAHRGFAVVEVELVGKASHSSQPADGVNALTHLGRLLAAVEARDAEIVAGPAHPLSGRGSLVATIARGGSSPFVVPASAHAVIERRTVPGEPSTVGLAEVRRILDALRAADPAVCATARTTLAREAWEVGESPLAAKLMDLLAAALVAAGSRPPRRTGAPYWMESALWAGAGVPTVVCGPAGGGMHADDEWVDLAQLRAYARALLEVVHSFCGPAGKVNAGRRPDGLGGRT